MSSITFSQLYRNSMTKTINNVCNVSVTSCAVEKHLHPSISWFQRYRVFWRLILVHIKWTILVWDLRIRYIKLKAVAMSILHTRIDNVERNISHRVCDSHLRSFRKIFMNSCVALQIAFDLIIIHSVNILFNFFLQNYCFRLLFSTIF